MINLLPPQTKSEITYARRNTRLFHWSIALIVTMLGALLIVAFGYVYLSQSVVSYQQRISEGEERLRIQKLEETQARVNQISGNLKLAVDVLSQEILFSKIITRVGAATPEGARLTDLNITDVSGGIDLKFEAVDQETGAQILTNLKDENNKVFDDADIEQIQCDSNKEYPCLVSIRALFGDNSPYLFINDGVKE